MSPLVRLAGSSAALALLGTVMAWFAGVFHEKIDTDPVAAATPVPAGAEVLEIRATEEPIIERASGTVRAKNETVVSSRITAAIAAIHVRAGDRVEAGDVLVELDARDLQARLAQQNEAVRAARARLAEARPSFERTEALFERNLVSKADYDRALAVLRAAEAELARAEQAAAEARTALSYSTIHAPFAGRVIERFADPGDTAVPAQPLVRLYDPRLLRLEAYVRESLAGRIELGMQLEARIDALGRDLSVRIDEVVPSAEPGSRAVLVKAVLPPDAAIYPGMFGRLLIPHGARRALYIPPAAIRRIGELEMVSLVTPQGVLRRMIRTGESRREGLIEVRSGLDEGERILATPL